MSTASLVYPHQLFEDHPAIRGGDSVILVEDPLFFRQYRFHRNKLILHRASMQSYAARLRRQGCQVKYVEADALTDSGEIAHLLKESKIRSVRFVDPCDDWLGARLQRALEAAGIESIPLADPHFLTPLNEIEAFVRGKDRLHFTDFYIGQRKRLGILLDRGRPTGGKWSYDAQNRKRLPQGIIPPPPPLLTEDSFVHEARDYVRERFPDAPGEDTVFPFPVDRQGALHWLREFIDQRLPGFGDYEDAISVNHDLLYHSALTPMLNIGLLSPEEIVKQALSAGDRVPLNSLEGFVRQLIGWREFVRLVYLQRGRRQRSRNFLNNTRAMPAAFYHAETGIDPVDHVIRRTLRGAYCHHIERLMILGNFMLLCDIHPDAIYQWFMELFIDAYDWVMVPNVYGMSQYADGGGMTTKPYISGSSYVCKMSDFKKGPWCEIWDALYWRFVDRHAELLAANPRTVMAVRMRDRLGPGLVERRRVAEAYLAALR